MELLIDTILQSDNLSGLRYGLALLNHLTGKCGMGCEKIISARLVTVPSPFSTPVPSGTPSVSLNSSGQLPQQETGALPSAERTCEEKKEAAEQSEKAGEPDAKSCQCGESKCERDHATMPLPPLPISATMTRVIFDEDESFDLTQPRACYESDVSWDALPAIVGLLFRAQSDFLRCLEPIPSSSSYSANVSSLGGHSRTRSNSLAPMNGSRGLAKSNGQAEGSVFGFVRLQVLKSFEGLLDLGVSLFYPPILFLIF